MAPATARAFKVNRRTVRKWLRRYQSEAMAGLFDRSRAPHHPRYGRSFRSKPCPSSSPKPYQPPAAGHGHRTQKATPLLGSPQDQEEL
ncbi:MAG: helix-turn-helix domain-containing protein [Deltaproteobacteria bacterium]|nr:helix-turn-helix domain-containing protein [Deltaproteobacteria bacterium]